MSALAIILIVLGVLVILVFVGGLVASRRREEAHAGEYARHLAEADQALEEARAADKGWDRAVMEAAVQRALEEQRPGFRPEKLELVLVDDRPGRDRGPGAFRGRRGRRRGADRPRARRGRLGG